jgi:peptidylprolyl isomerase
MKYLSYIACFVAVLVIASGCSGPKEQTKKQSDQKSEYQTTPSGLEYKILRRGVGPTPEPGDKVVVHYVGLLEDSTKFDSSFDRKKPFKFVIGMGKVIKGWDEGVMMMREGGKRELVIPPDLGYGSRGIGKIPPNSTLIFQVELLDIIKKDKKK